MSYADVIPVLQTAASRPDGLRYRLPSYGKAVNFRQRCYRYRQALRKTLEIVPGLIPSTPYDDLIIMLETPTGSSIRAKIDAGPGPVDVVISHGFIEGEMLSALGEAIDAAQIGEADDGLGLE